ncbi:MAG: SdpI family protein [Parafannyhessea umbonata]|nr:SdpI family protein [Parafannyhessea umbonata]
MATSRTFWGFYQGFVVVLTVFMCALSWMADLAALGVLPHEGSGFVGIAVPLGVGLLFVWIGNYLPRVRRNYTFGVRTSWALEDERTWQKTQRMGGITFVIMGIALMALGLASQAMPGEVVFAVLLAVVLGGSGWTMLYSYLVWRGGDR